MAKRNRKHIYISKGPSVDPFQAHRKGMNFKPLPPPPNPVAHATNLGIALERAGMKAKWRRKVAGWKFVDADKGFYVEFEPQPKFQLKLASLENKKANIELVNVRKESGGQRATVYVPDKSIGHFLSRFNDYAKSPPPKKNRAQKAFVESVAKLRLATLRQLWTDDADSYPLPTERIWWEVWLRRPDDTKDDIKVLQRFRSFAKKVDMVVGQKHLVYEDRIIVLAEGTVKQLGASVDVLGDLAEVRRAKENPASFLNMGPVEQNEWVEELAGRVKPAARNAPAVCLLDTGVSRVHPLLTSSLADSDMHTCEPDWRTGDHEGHGTEMAGLALYGDLTSPLLGHKKVKLRHRLESVKILPRHGDNPPELYGAISAQAVSLPEIEAPKRRRVFSLAVSSIDQRDRGQPTSWSASLDALAVGRAFDPKDGGLEFLDRMDDEAKRLFIVCTGNASEHTAENFLDRCDLEVIHDPAQAWNILTVGAYTNLDVLDVDDPTWQGWEPVAPAGELSPYSTTSVGFGSPWPFKPDVVFEGGNIVHKGNDIELPVDALSLLTTHYKPHERLLERTCATSAATAQVARMAGRLLAEYPDFWPETIRALIIHSARWTKRMSAHCSKNSLIRDRHRLLRRYGHGVPSLRRAVRSADNALTLIVQNRIRPFKKVASAGKMREMHLHQLPWPKEVLEELGEVEVRMRVTLSYFIEPYPARRGWTKRHRYASHGLRFEVKHPTESISLFRKRVNRMALDEDIKEKRPATRDTTGWFLGKSAHDKGSVHSDVWTGTAADLAERGVLAIYLVVGWWKEMPKKDKSEQGARYTLLISLETDSQGVDFWTSVSAQVDTEIEGEVEIKI